MVYRQIDKSKTIRRRKSRFVLSIIFLILVLIVSGGTLGYYIGESKKDISIENSSSEETEDKEKQEQMQQNNIPVIDFQPVVDEWADGVRGNKSVIIYDLDNSTTVASLNANAIYNTASLYKLFVVYEGYKRVDNGEWREDLYLPAARQTILECLDLAIRESDSVCAEAIWNKIGHSDLDEIVRDGFMAGSTNLDKLISTPEDIVKIMKLYYKHPDIKNDSLLRRIKDSLLNQPTTTYNWRQGLPSGFSVARVYNKVGWEFNPDKKYWNVYHDAAIVEFPDSKRHFIVVVMTNYVSFERIRDLGTMIESYFNKY